MAAGSTSTDSMETEHLLDKNKDRTFLSILVTGKTGVGKFRLENALVDRNITKEDACKSTPYETTIENVAVKVWDSPGLQDGTSNEDQYIQDMKYDIEDIALMIYCVRMDETRFYDADKKAIRILTEEFGKDAWKHAVVAMTFANKVEDPDGEDELRYFQSQLEEWKKQFNEYFASVGVDPEVCIPVIPAGNKLKSMRLPDRENWLSDLWIECRRVMKPSSSTLVMYRIDSQRLVKALESRTTLDAGAYESQHQASQFQWTQPLAVVKYLNDKLWEYFGGQYFEG